MAQEAAQSVHGLAALEILPRYVSGFTDRQGKRRWRFRKRGVQGYFSDRPGSKRFESEYRQFMRGMIPETRPKKYTSSYSVSTILEGLGWQ